MPLSCRNSQNSNLALSSALTFTASVSVKDRIDCEFRKDFEVRKHEKLAAESRRSFISRGATRISRGAHIIQSGRAKRPSCALVRTTKLSSKGELSSRRVELAIKNFRKQQIRCSSLDSGLIERDPAQERRHRGETRELKKKKRENAKESKKSGKGTLRKKREGKKKAERDRCVVLWVANANNVAGVSVDGGNLATSVTHWNPTLNFNLTCTKVGPFPSLSPTPPPIPIQCFETPLYRGDVGRELQATVHFRDPHLPRLLPFIPLASLPPSLSTYDVWTNVRVYGVS